VTRGLTTSDVSSLMTLRSQTLCTATESWSRSFTQNIVTKTITRLQPQPFTEETLCYPMCCIQCTRCICTHEYADSMLLYTLQCTAGILCAVYNMCTLCMHASCCPLVRITFQTLRHAAAYALTDAVSFSFISMFIIC
jgi:hypothetical protein